MIEIKRNKQKPAQVPAERTQMSADGREARPGKEPAPAAESPLQAGKWAATGMDTGRDYRAMYRAVFDFHVQHYPPRIDQEYWQTHRPGIDDTPQTEIDFWAQTWKDLRVACEKCGNDPFVVAMMGAVMSEFNREYKAGQQAASQGSTPA